MGPGGWGIVLCSCNGALPVDPVAVQELLGLGQAPSVVPSLSPEVMGELTGRGGWEVSARVLVGCCAPPEALAAGLAATGIPLERATVLDLKPACPAGQDRQAAAVTAARLIRAAMAAAEEERARPPLRVGVAPTALIVTDGPAGLALAERLAPHIRATVILDGERPAVAPGTPAPPFEIRPGRAVEVRGHLGEFAVTVEPRTPGQPTTIQAPQVVVLVGGEARLPRAGRHTGYHVAPPGAAPDLDGLARQVLGLVGDFVRPAYVEYNPATCAAGTAAFQGCGICVPACPYDALAREGRRIRVDERACEGCGACIAVCPTSSLRFTEPSEGALCARMRALLGPLPGRAAEPRPVLLLHCPEEGAAILRRAAGEGGGWPGSLLPVPLPCLRFASEAVLLEAFRLGAAGVALLGCDACAHGEREVLFGKLEVVQTVLEVFGLGRDRVAVFTGTRERSLEPLAALARFADGLSPSPVPWPREAGGPLDNRSVIARAVAALLDATGREPGRVRFRTPQPFARVEVNEAGCTLCGGCAFVCPTHAITRDERRNVVEFTHVKCVACGMCEPACPERVITLHRELVLEREALRPRVLAEDAMIACERCGKAYINRRALEIIEARVLSLASLGDTFAGERRGILRLCPDCRAAAAVLEMQQGWEP
jgi:ferredoxin